MSGEEAPFGERLRRLRVGAGLTQEELAAKAGLTAKAEVSDRPNAAFCLQGPAAVAEAHDDAARAARLLGAAEVLLEGAGVPRYAMVDQDLHRRVAYTARARLGDRAWEEAREEVRAMSFEEAASFVFDREDPAPA